MLRIAILGFLMSSSLGFACSLCGGSLVDRPTLREQANQAQAVILGTFKNAKADGDFGGTTEFHFDDGFANIEALKGQTMLVLPKYYPTVGKSQQFLMFFEIDGKKVDAIGGIPGGKPLLDHVQAVAKLPAKDGVARLGHYFKKLDSPDEAISSDAFREFAKASDADLESAKGHYDAKKLRAWLRAKETPEERLGVYSVMLALCGEVTDKDTFAVLLKEPLNERIAANLAGVLAANVLIDAEQGWAALRGFLGDRKRSFERRYAALQAIRFLQATRASDHRKSIAATYGEFCTDDDLGDLLIDDLRRWGWWDCTTEVLSAYAKAKSKLAKSTILRYALSSPNAECATFIAATRKTEPDLVAKAEALLKLLK